MLLTSGSFNHKDPNAATLKTFYTLLNAVAENLNVSLSQNKVSVIRRVHPPRRSSLNVFL